MEVKWSMPPLRKKCPYSELFWSVFARIQIEYRGILCMSPYSVRMRINENKDCKKCEKNEYGRFSRSAQHCTTNKFSIKDFFGKCDQIRRKLQIWSRLLRKSLMENFIFLCCVKTFIQLTQPKSGFQAENCWSLLNLSIWKWLIENIIAYDSMD